MREVDRRHEDVPVLRFHLGVVTVEVELAQRTNRGDAVGSPLLGFVEQNIDEADPRFRQRPGQAAATAFGLQGIVDNRGSQGFHELVHGRRVVLIVEGRVGTDDLAAVVRGDLQALERLPHFLSDGLQADVVDQDIQRVPDRGISAVMKSDGVERLVHGRLHLRIIMEVVLGLVQDQVAGRAGSHDLVEAALFGQGQVAGRQHAGLDLVH